MTVFFRLTDCFPVSPIQYFIHFLWVNNIPLHWDTVGALFILISQMGNESDSPRSEDDYRQSQAICLQSSAGKLHLNTSSKYWPIESHGMNHCLMKNNMTILYACNLQKYPEDKSKLSGNSIDSSCSQYNICSLLIHSSCICFSL